jgi:hypothetical protein
VDLSTGARMSIGEKPATRCAGIEHGDLADSTQVRPAPKLRGWIWIVPFPSASWKRTRLDVNGPPGGSRY